MINGELGPVQASSIVNLVPIGGIAPVFRSGDAYKAVGELVQRSIYTALSAAFPRNGSLASVASTPLTTNVWQAGAYGAGVFVVVGNASGGGATTSGMYSTDGGKTWLLMTMPSGVWTDVVYGGGKFVAITSGTAAATSTDGINWTAQTLPSAAGWTSIAYGSGVYVAVAGLGTNAASSADGVTWTPRTLPTSASWNDVTFGNGVFLAIAIGTNAAATSTNGTSWTARTMPAVGARRVAYGANLFVAVGDSAFGCYSSPDGVTWTQRTVPPSAGATLYNVMFGDGVFVAQGSGAGYCAVSYDGMTWLIKSYVGTGTSGGFAAYGAGSFLIGASNSGSAFAVVYAENLTDSDYLYLSGTAGQFVRVK